MKRAWVPTLLLLAVVCVGCQRDCFEIEVTPEGDVVWQLTLHGISQNGRPGQFFKAERIGSASD